MKRDIEKTYSRNAFIAKLRRLADALERIERFSIQVAGERIVVPRVLKSVSSTSAKAASSRSSYK